MDFDAFISRCRQEWTEFDDPRRLARSIHPQTRDLSHVLRSIPGMATENKIKLLNLAARSLGADEVYVEVGCYKGATLVAASLGNSHAKFYGCDNFSQFDGATKALRETLARYTPPGQVSFHDVDFREFLGLSPWHPAQIGVYFYDGGHSFSDQYEGLSHAVKHFADSALIIVDDTNKREARSANLLFARKVKEFELVLDLRTPRNHHPTWWNGIQVFHYQRDYSARKVELPGEGFEIRKLFYDDILLNFKHFRRGIRRSIKNALPVKRRQRR